MANKTVALYRYIKVEGKWKYCSAPSRLRKLAHGAYYISWYEGAKKRLVCVGSEPDVALAAQSRKQAELKFVAAGGEVKEVSNASGTRLRVTAAFKDYLDDCRDRQGKSGYGLAKTTVAAYSYRLQYLAECEPQAYLDEINAEFMKRFRRFQSA